MLTFKIFLLGFKKKEKLLKKFICMKHWTDIITHHNIYLKKNEKNLLGFLCADGLHNENQFTSFLINYC